MCWIPAGEDTWQSYICNWGIPSTPLVCRRSYHFPFRWLQDFPNFFYYPFAEHPIIIFIFINQKIIKKSKLMRGILLIHSYCWASLSPYNTDCSRLENGNTNSDTCWCEWPGNRGSYVEQHFPLYAGPRQSSEQYTTGNEGGSQITVLA